MAARSLSDALSWLLPGVLCYVDTDRPVFALTFDDGPDPATTPSLLDVLAEHRARATFFLIGERLPGNETLVDRIVAEGHEIANHLMRDEPAIRLSDRDYRDALSRTQDLLGRHGGSRWFRPGSGWVTPRMLRSAGDLGLGCVLGTVVARHDGGPGDRRIAGRLLRRTRRGSVVVLHESAPERTGVLASTREVLHGLALRGLGSVTVSDLVEQASRPGRPPVRRGAHPAR